MKVLYYNPIYQYSFKNFFKLRKKMKKVWYDKWFIIFLFKHDKNRIATHGAVIAILISEKASED